SRGVGTGIHRRGRGRCGRRIRCGRRGLRPGGVLPAGGWLRRRRGVRSAAHGGGHDHAGVLRRGAASADARQQFVGGGAGVLVGLIVAVVVIGDGVGETFGDGLVAGVVVIFAI